MQIRNEIRMHKNDYCNKLKSSNNSLWKMSKILWKPYKKIPQLCHNNQSYNTDQQKAEMLAKTYKETLNSEIVVNAFRKQIRAAVSNWNPEWCNFTKLFPKPFGDEIYI